MENLKKKHKKFEKHHRSFNCMQSDSCISIVFSSYLIERLNQYFAKFDSNWERIEEKLRDTTNHLDHLKNELIATEKHKSKNLRRENGCESNALSLLNQLIQKNCELIELLKQKDNLRKIIHNSNLLFDLIITINNEERKFKRNKPKKLRKKLKNFVVNSTEDTKNLPPKNISPPNNNLSPIKEKILIDLVDKSLLASPKPSTEEKGSPTLKKKVKRKKIDEKENHFKKEQQTTRRNRKRLKAIKIEVMEEKKKIVGKEYSSFITRSDNPFLQDKIEIKPKCKFCNLSFDLEEFHLHLLMHRSKLIEDIEDDSFHLAKMLQQTNRSIIEHLDECNK